MAKSKKAISIALVLILAFALAATTGLASGTGSTQDSSGKVEFTTGGGEDGNGGGTGGYDLIVVPSFDFGSIAITPDTITKDDTATAANYLKLKDVSGTRTGWKITAKLSNFYLSDGGSGTLSTTVNTLPNSSITLKFVLTDVTQHGSDTATAVLTNTGVPKPTVPAPAALALSSGAAAVTKVLSAPAAVSPAIQPGTGCWWVAMKATFSMPGSRAQVGEHVAELYWAMENVPV